MDSFTGKLAVVTGGGSGMGRELARQLAAQGCSVAACDWNTRAVAQAAAMAQAGAPDGVLVTGHVCDVCDEAQVLRFRRDELLEQHGSDHVDLVFANVGIGGGGSFVKDRREDWERTFAIDWWGVYYCARAFLPLLIASGDDDYAELFSGEQKRHHHGHPSARVSGPATGSCCSVDLRHLHR